MKFKPVIILLLATIVLSGCGINSEDNQVESLFMLTVIKMSESSFDKYKQQVFSILKSIKISDN